MYCRAAELVLDGVVAQDETQAARLWSLREQIAVGLAHAGMVYKYDLSVPQHLMYVLYGLCPVAASRTRDLSHTPASCATAPGMSL